MSIATIKPKLAHLWRIQSIHQWRRWQFWTTWLAQFLPIYALIYEAAYVARHWDDLITVGQALIGLAVLLLTSVLAIIGTGYRDRFLERYCSTTTNQRGYNASLT